MPPTSATVEEDFEEVGLDEPKPQPQPRKRGFFAKFADAGHDNANSTSGAVGSSGIPSSSSNQGPVSRLLMTGRKRGQSGQGAELGNLDHPAKNTADERND